MSGLGLGAGLGMGAGIGTGTASSGVVGPSQKAKLPIAVSPYALFADSISNSISNSTGSSTLTNSTQRFGASCTCPHLALLKYDFNTDTNPNSDSTVPNASNPAAVALSRSATILLDRYRDLVRSLLGNCARGASFFTTLAVNVIVIGHFPLHVSTNANAEVDSSKKRKKLSQLEVDIGWVQAIPLPFCKICADTGLGRLHACLHCSFVGCFKHKHINAHLLDQNNPHFLAVDFHHAAIYCVKCKDYIWDLDFERILSGERVRMDALISKIKDSSVRRSKTVEWSPTLDEALKIQKFSVPLRHCSGLRGLSNMGSTLADVCYVVFIQCFMNVVLQTFIHNPLLRAHFLSDKHNQDLCPLKIAGKICMACEMDTLFTNFYSGEVIPFSPSNFLYATWMSNTALAHYAQQDAHEFFIAVLNEIHSNCASGSIGGKENTNCRCVIHQVFQGYLQSDVTCSQCRNVTTTKDPILDLSLNIKSSGPGVNSKKKSIGSGSTPNLTAATLNDTDFSCTLVDCLERNFAAETLTHYQCGNPGCAKSSESVKHVTIKNLPPVLSIQLKRFEHSGQGSKVDTHVRIPSELDMTPFTTHSVQARMEKNSSLVAAKSKPGVSGSIGSYDVLNDSVPEHRYSLFAVINHQGSLETGHYTAYVKSRGDWFLFDDHTVTLATQKEVLASKVYMCYYFSDGQHTI
ncbi:hypothetical protein HK100_011007 [Physocladia obscura]|uniref:Ubiquitinyl hydrolase 1 n=1 Tax=Physocladia obscura TaxID=109957 RepID=A0AAD5T2H8_9FUNG|nr:hypothetical protein HK100_011007 [Physocladia obscura]